MKKFLKNIEIANCSENVNKYIDNIPLRLEFNFVYRHNPYLESASVYMFKRRNFKTYFSAQKRFLYNLANNSGGRVQAKTAYFSNLNISKKKENKKNENYFNCKIISVWA